jgi:hypothetical protein
MALRAASWQPKHGFPGTAKSVQSPSEAFILDAEERSAFHNERSHNPEFSKPWLGKPAWKRRFIFLNSPNNGPPQADSTHAMALAMSGSASSAIASSPRVMPSEGHIFITASKAMRNRHTFC